MSRDSYYYVKFMEYLIFLTEDKAKFGNMDMTTNEHKRAKCWETCIQKYICIHQPPTWNVKQSQTDRGDRSKCEKQDKGAHKNQNILGSLFLWREPGDVPRAVNIFDLLSVGIEIKHHGTTGPDQEPHTHHVIEGMNESIE